MCHNASFLRLKAIISWSPADLDQAEGSASNRWESPQPEVCVCVCVCVRSL